MTFYLPLQSSVVKTENDTDDSSDAQSFTDESVMEDALSPQSSTVDSTVNTEMPGEEKTL